MPENLKLWADTIHVMALRPNDAVCDEANFFHPLNLFLESASQWAIGSEDHEIAIHCSSIFSNDTVLA